MLFTVLVLFALQEVDGRRIVSVDSSYVSGQRLDFAVRRADLENGPKWNEVSNDPPLAPRQAIYAAEGKLSTLVSHPAEWRLSLVSLRPTLGKDAWVYVVEFSAQPPEPVGGLTTSLRIVVLMTGIAIEPSRTPWPPIR